MQIYLKRNFNTVGFKWNLIFFKITNSSNLFEDIPAMSLTHSKSLITCNSHNDRLTWKCIHLPKCYSVQNLVEVYFHIFIFFNYNLFQFIKRLKFFLLSLKEFLRFPSQVRHSVVIDWLFFEGEQLSLVYLNWT